MTATSRVRAQGIGIRTAAEATNVFTVSCTSMNGRRQGKSQAALGVVAAHDRFLGICEQKPDALLLLRFLEGPAALTNEDARDRSAAAGIPPT